MILIIDNGSQYTHLIKRNCRDLGFDAEIINAKATLSELDKLLQNKVERIILSGGPGSVYMDPPNLSNEICERIKSGKLNVPLLGICYGQQMIAHCFGAKVAKGKSAEYGFCQIELDEETGLLKEIPKSIRAWVSHFDEVKELPKDFVKIAHSESCEIEGMRHRTKKIYSVQFHPEVWHTEHGEKIIENFLKI
ncbi:MAG: GMP synthase subunit A [Candidatus Bilamarchaeum sp.]|jgi:GMP synthase (glutamine-hydrolysing)